MKNLLLASLFVTWAGACHAHSALEMSVPAAGETIAAAPEALEMTFKKGIRLTKVSLTRMDNPSVLLDLTGSKGFITDYSIPVNLTDIGNYLIEWRGLGQDGHVVTGDFTFEVK